MTITRDLRWNHHHHRQNHHHQRNVWCRKCRHEGGAGNHHYLKLVLKYNLSLGFTYKQYKYNSKYKYNSSSKHYPIYTQCNTASAQKNRAAVWSQKSLQFSSQMCTVCTVHTVVQSANQNWNTNFPAHNSGISFNECTVHCQWVTGDIILLGFCILPFWEHWT